MSGDEIKLLMRRVHSRDTFVVSVAIKLGEGSDRFLAYGALFVLAALAQFSQDFGAHERDDGRMQGSDGLDHGDSHFVVWVANLVEKDFCKQCERSHNKRIRQLRESQRTVEIARHFRV